jgi:WD40 repeat protein
VGGWDGKIRLFSTKSGKPLGTLRYHKTACQTLAFAHHFSDSTVEEDDLDRDRKLETRFWLLGGGKDGRISVWNLVDLGKPSSS